jgi:hypothetical protein
MRPLTNDLSDYCAVILTADSKSMVTTQCQTLGNIWVAPKGETAHAAQITAGLGRYFDLTWAPDGEIIFASDASGSADIYETAANGSQVRQLTSGMKRNYAPAVSRDNRFIVFHSNRSGVFQVWRMDRDGSNPQQLTFGEAESHWPQFSADGKFVYYQHSSRETRPRSGVFRRPVARPQKSLTVVLSDLQFLRMVSGWLSGKTRASRGRHGNSCFSHWKASSWLRPL